MIDAEFIGQFLCAPRNYGKAILDFFDGAIRQRVGISCGRCDFLDDVAQRFVHLGQDDVFFFQLFFVHGFYLVFIGEKIAGRDFTKFEAGLLAKYFCVKFM